MAASADRIASRAAPEKPDVPGETLQFMKRKFLNIAPVWYTVLIALVLTDAVIKHLSLSSVIGLLQNSVPSFLMLSELGLGEQIWIPFSWYVCVMMVALLILFRSSLQTAGALRARLRSCSSPTAPTRCR